MNLYVNDVLAFVGETYTTLRGDMVVLLAIKEPYKPSSSGRVVLEFSNGAVGEFYPSVIGGVWK